MDKDSLVRGRQVEMALSAFRGQLQDVTSVQDLHRFAAFHPLDVAVVDVDGAIGVQLPVGPSGVLRRYEISTLKIG